MAFCRDGGNPLFGKGDADNMACISKLTKVAVVVARPVSWRFAVYEPYSGNHDEASSWRSNIGHGGKLGTVMVVFLQWIVQEWHAVVVECLGSNQAHFHGFAGSDMQSAGV